MLRVYSKKRGKIVPGMLRDISAARVDWIDCLSPTLKEQETISKRFGIPLADIDKLLRKETRPHVYSGRRFSAIVLVAPYHSVKSKSIKKAPLVIFVNSDKDILTLHNKPFEAFDELIKDFEPRPEIFRNPTKFLYEVLDQINQNCYVLLENVEPQLDALEAVVFRNHQDISIREIFRLRKSLMYLHKILIGNREIVNMIEKGTIPQLTKSELLDFRHLYNDIINLADVRDTYHDILSSIMEMYLSQVSNNLNTIMKRLTAWGSLILIPTLIASIYGMNFKVSAFNMPELYWEYGYLFSLGLMAGSVALLAYYFKRKNWF